MEDRERTDLENELLATELRQELCAHESAVLERISKTLRAIDPDDPDLKHLAELIDERDQEYDDLGQMIGKLRRRLDQLPPLQRGIHSRCVVRED
jgi:hypothetical protein